MSGQTIDLNYFVRRWKSGEVELAKGDLIDDDGHCCAHGDVLRTCGWTDLQLRSPRANVDTDAEVAAKLGVSVAHSVLIRTVNDWANSDPGDAIDLVNGGAQRILGSHAALVLAFWRFMDTLSPEAWSLAGRNWADLNMGAYKVVTAKAYTLDGIRDAAAAAAPFDIRGATGAAAWATWEIQRWPERQHRPFFISAFGITDPYRDLAAYIPKEMTR